MRALCLKENVHLTRPHSRYFMDRTVTPSESLYKTALFYEYGVLRVTTPRALTFTNSPKLGTAPPPLPKPLKVDRTLLFITPLCVLMFTMLQRAQGLSTSRTNGTEEEGEGEGEGEGDVKRPRHTKLPHRSSSYGDALQALGLGES